MTIWRHLSALMVITLALSATPNAAHAAYHGQSGEEQRFSIFVNGTRAGEYIIQYKHHKKNAWTVTAQQSYVLASADGSPRKVRLIVREYWVGDEFYRLEGKVADNDVEAKFTARRDKDTGEINVTGIGPEMTATLPKDAIPFSFWNKDAMATAPVVFEVMTAKPVGAGRAEGKSETLTLDGKERTCTGHRVASSRGLVDVWYDEDQRMCAAHMQFPGGIMVFKPQTQAEKEAPAGGTTP